MSALALTALAAVVLGAAMVGISIGSALQVHRMNKLEARVVVLEQDSHTHDFFGSKPKLAQGGFIGNDHGAIPLVVPKAALSHVNVQRVWDGAGYHS
jgi:hypothetical protein